MLERKLSCMVYLLLDVEMYFWSLYGRLCISLNPALLLLRFFFFRSSKNNIPYLYDYCDVAKFLNRLDLTLNWISIKKMIRINLQLVRKIVHPKTTIFKRIHHYTSYESKNMISKSFLHVLVFNSIYGITMAHFMRKS